MLAQRMVPALCLVSMGCVTSVHDGMVVPENPEEETITFSGYTFYPQDQLSVQVRAGNEDAWTTLPGTITPTSTSITDSFGDTLYLFSAELDLSAHWQAGGLMQIRATEASSSTYLGMLRDPEAAITDFIYGDDFTTIYYNHSDGYDAILANAAAFPLPAENTLENRWLARHDTPISSSQLYYDAIDAGESADRGTYWGWLTANGFASGEKPSVGNWPLSPSLFTMDVRAVYFNQGDLALGRDLRCRNVMAHDPGGPCEGTRTSDFVMRTACMVKNTNSGIQPHDASQDFVDLTLAQTAGGLGTGTVVTMEKIFHDHNAQGFSCASPPGPPAQDDVRFYVYDAGDDNLETSIQLDEDGLQGIPGICVSCHGGDIQTDRDGTPHVVGGQFLPLDVASFKYSEDALIAGSATGDHATLDDQHDEFRQINQLVYDTQPNQSIIDLLTLWYGDAPEDGSTSAETDAVPSGWSGNEEIYQHVVAPYCRTCHVGLADVSSAPDWDTFTEFAQWEASIKTLVCDNQTMPHAQLTQQRFWDSNARALLVREFGWEGDCAPIGE